MVISVNEAIDYDSSVKIKITRYGAGSYVNGKWQDGAISTFYSLASVQQPTPKQLEILPENERTPDMKVFISKKPLRITDVKNQTKSDVITYKGDNYKISYLGDWGDFGYTYVIGAKLV